MTQKKLRNETELTVFLFYHDDKHHRNEVCVSTLAAASDPPPAQIPQLHTQTHRDIVLEEM